jgi:hypothetical protein
MRAICEEKSLITKVGWTKMDLPGVLTKALNKTYNSIEQTFFDWRVHIPYEEG